ncbi:MAG: hypothetical protein HY261_05775 [Chloroflexi bacterium]|nr:hypothetical protein [Chloroflexota bacterium]
MKVNIAEHQAERVPPQKLVDFECAEKDLQKVLFNSLDRLLPDEELLVIAQSRQWQEEPDILALDDQGRLFIFELKKWESRSENILQVLRYGQLFGRKAYEELDRRFRQFRPDQQSLVDAHAATFGHRLPESKFNETQVFVVVTNGLDFTTREAVRYWRGKGVDVRPWIYRAYKDPNSRREHFLLEMQRFSVNDNPYEDLTSTGFFVVNTNYRNSREDHKDMLKNHIAAAFNDPWKFKIERLTRQSTVFLYQSGKGIVAIGRVAGGVQKADHRGKSDYKFYVHLDKFARIKPPISAAEVNDLTGRQYSFQGTLFEMDTEAAEIVSRAARQRSRISAAGLETER